jgi:hypothetical protein
MLIPIRLPKVILLLCGCIAGASTHGQAPDTIDEMIYREQVQFVDGSIGSTVLLTPDRRYSTVVVYHALSRAVWITGHLNAGPNEVGTYIYRRTSATAATLTFVPDTPGALSQITHERSLTFISANAGSVFVQWAEGGRGEFQLHPRSGIPLANVATRGLASATKPLIMGIVVTGKVRDVLIRAVGPSLRQFGVNDAADDTTLELNGNNIAPLRNDDWGNDPEGTNRPSLGLSSAPTVIALGEFVGAFPLTIGSKDAAYPVRLQAGNYTMIVRTKSSEPTEVLAEAYVVP